MKKDPCRRIVYLTVYVIILSLFLYSLLFCYPYNSEKVQTFGLRVLVMMQCLVSNIVRERVLWNESFLGWKFSCNTC